MKAAHGEPLLIGFLVTLTRLSKNFVEGMTQTLVALSLKSKLGNGLSTTHLIPLLTPLGVC